MKTDEGKRERILAEAVRLFSSKGFHGTSMRDIATGAECSLPMLYYYYKNKDDLFYEVAYTELVELIERMNREVVVGPTLQETYFNAMKQRKELCEYDKAVYKLSLMVWLGFDGDSKVKQDLSQWENGRLERTRSILARHIGDHENLHIFASLLTRIMENMTEKIIMLNEDIPDEEIKAEIETLIKLIKA